jgi:hypothetical protein
MGLGDKAAALALSERGIAVLPIEKDAISGADPIEILAPVAAQMGEPDRAIAALQQLLSIPGEGALGEIHAAHSGATPARSHVRSAPGRSALPEIGFAWTKVGDPNNAPGTLWYAGHMRLPMQSAMRCTASARMML